MTLLKKIEIQMHQDTDQLDFEDLNVIKGKYFIKFIQNYKAIKNIAKDRKQKQ